MDEYYDKVQIGEYDNGEPTHLRIKEIFGTETLEEETRATIFGTLK